MKFSLPWGPMLMKIKTLHKNLNTVFFFDIQTSSGRIDYSNPHVRSEPNRYNSLNDNRLDGRTDRRTDAGTSPHRTMISASSILAELKMGFKDDVRMAEIWVMTVAMLCSSTKQSHKAELKNLPSKVFPSESVKDFEGPGTAAASIDKRKMLVC